MRTGRSPLCDLHLQTQSRRCDNMDSNSFQASFRIDGNHPALPGHFPSRPVVPGVILLDRVAAALAIWRGRHIVALIQVKFLLPLLPEQDAEIRLHDDGKNIRFDIVHNDQSNASGILQTQPIAASSTAPPGGDGG
jgi:3-hydroxyacyl-[acyl-carrier-protein] dehydratase